MVSPGEDLVLLTQRQKYHEEKVLRTGHELPRGLVLRKGRHRMVNTQKTRCLKRSLAKQQARDCRKRSCKRAMALRQGLVIR